MTSLPDKSISRLSSVPPQAAGNAFILSKELMENFDREKSIDIFREPSDRDPDFSTDYLFSPARGLMFGILECADRHGGTVILNAFSGQYNGRWLVPGWVPPVIDPDEFERTVTDIDRKIKELDIKIENPGTDVSERKSYTAERKEISRKLMKDIHALYHLSNFMGERGKLTDIFERKNIKRGVPSGTGALKGTGVPSGTGDCCAPKLLNYAALNNLTPVSMAEFYYGLENRSGTKKHKTFYPPCREKCIPILGFLLRGLDKIPEGLCYE